MLKLTLKGLQANKIRFALTTFGVVLAVSFVVSALVLGDGLRRSFTGVSQDITSGVDIQVRAVSDFGDPPPLPPELVDVIAQVDGVAAAQANIEAGESAVRPIPPDGEPISIYGPPQLAFNWAEDAQMSPFELVTGAAPLPGEFVMDIDSAADHGFVVGDVYDVFTPSGLASLRLSGTFTFGPQNTTLGSLLMAMNTDEAADLFDKDGIDTVEVRVAPDADVATVQAQIAAVVPGLEVVDNATVLAETTAEFTEAVDIVQNILLGFGGVALFVSMFIIYNTFAIVIGQRTRELALLRTLGASPSQIRRSVMGESVVIGTLASALGIGGGVLTAKGIDALVAALGVGLPDYPFVLSGRTIVAALVIGFGVTVVAATGPARKASTIPAIAALSAVDQSTSVGSRTRKVSGTVMITFGAVIGALGLSGAGSTAVTVAAMALGAMGVFLGVATLSPLMVEAVTTIIGWPLRRVSGVAGTMAQRNAARNPRRTATTAAALMIGLALVSTAIVVGDSIKQHIGGTIEEVARADYFITDDLDEVDLPAELTSELAQTGMVDQVAGFAYTEAELNGEVVDITVTDFETIDALLDLDFSPGALANPTAVPVVVRAEQAQRLAIVEGDIITTRLADGTTVEATVTGTFGESGGVVTDYLYDVASAEAIGLSPSYEWVAFNLADGVSASMADTLADAVAEQLPDVHVETADAYVERVQGSIDTLLAIVNVMVALAVVIALIGIANTLALSVFERTRELGLVRAVGMTRRQLRRMVRLEAAMVATFGAVLGIAVGLLFGWAVVTALPQTIAGSVSVPLQPLLSLMLVAAFSGVLAAVLPARRAGHLDVLDAIAH